MLPIFSQLSDEAQEALRDIVKDQYAPDNQFEGVKLLFIERSKGAEDDMGYQVFQYGDKLYQLNGWYSSYEGWLWDHISDIYEVVAREKTITVYDKV